jgi:hypothetical protein
MKYFGGFWIAPRKADTYFQQVQYPLILARSGQKGMILLTDPFMANLPDWMSFNAAACGPPVGHALMETIFPRQSGLGRLRPGRQARPLPQQPKKAWKSG